jgi:hypothetical protein
MPNSSIVTLPFTFAKGYLPQLQAIYLLRILKGKSSLKIRQMNHTE